MCVFARDLAWHVLFRCLVTMNSTTIYRHSGKFTLSGLFLALVAALVAAFPLGYIYAYVIKWVPFIYINVFIAGGFAFLWGFCAGKLLQLGKVRNNGMAAVVTLIVGLASVYFAWMGHISAYLGLGFPAPKEVLSGMELLYTKGSWSIRGYTFTGVPLGIAWGVEALMIVGLGSLASHLMISRTPFSERDNCWLDQEKKNETLEPILQADQIARLTAGDITSLDRMRSRPPGASQFARLTIKHSPRCQDFCVLDIANVAISTDSKGRTRQSLREIARDIILPKTVLDRF